MTAVDVPHVRGEATVVVPVPASVAEISVTEAGGQTVGGQTVSGQTRSRRTPPKAMTGDTAAESRVRPAPDMAYPSNMETRSAQRAGQQAPPTVNITIGRIEVRALPAAQPAAQQAAPQAQPEPQGLTLAQYLRGDDGRPR